MVEQLPAGQPNGGNHKRIDAHGQQRGGLHELKNFSRTKVAPNSLPTEKKLGYRSESAIYGATMKYDTGGQLYLDYQGFMPLFDRTFDYLARRTDDNTLKRPGKLLLKQPRVMLEHIAKGAFDLVTGNGRSYLKRTFGPKRYRGKAEEIFENIQRLGLDRYEAYRNEKGNIIGIAVKGNFWEEGRTLRNMYRAQHSDEKNIDGTYKDPSFLPGADELRNVDRIQAVADATRYIRDLHKVGAIGEVNTDDVIFTKIEDGRLQSPYFAVPDIVYNRKIDAAIEPKAQLHGEYLRQKVSELQTQVQQLRSQGNEEKAIEIEQSIERMNQRIENIPQIIEGERQALERERKAIDVLDFMMDVADEELAVGNMDTTRQALQTIVETYGDEAVIGTIKSLVKRGRLTLAEDKAVLEQQETAEQIPNVPDTMATRQLRSLLSFHNETRLRSRDNAVQFKRMVVDICDQFKNRNNPSQSPSH